VWKLCSAQRAEDRFDGFDLFRNKEDFPDVPPLHFVERVSRDALARPVKADNTPLRIQDHHQRTRRIRENGGHVPRPLLLRPCVLGS
jgi:hypothetical protein